MKGYELVFITNPDIKEKDLTDILKKFKKSLKDFGGELIHEHLWGLRRLAYEISGHDYGVYHAWYFTGNGKTVDELQRQFGYSDDILRNQIVKTNDLDAEATFLSDLIKPSEKSEEVNNQKEISVDFSNEDEIEDQVDDVKDDDVKDDDVKDDDVKDDDVKDDDVKDDDVKDDDAKDDDGKDEVEIKKNKNTTSEKIET